MESEDLTMTAEEQQLLDWCYAHFSEEQAYELGCVPAISRSEAKPR